VLIKILSIWRWQMNGREILPERHKKIIEHETKYI